LHHLEKGVVRYFRSKMYNQWNTSGVWVEEETGPAGAFKAMRDRSVQYSAMKLSPSNRMVEYERAIHAEPFSVKGTSCKAKSSTGDNVAPGYLDKMSITIGQLAKSSSSELIFKSPEVEIASLVLLSKITSKGANSLRTETSFHKRKSARIHCIACMGFFVRSNSLPMRTASVEKSAFYQTC
jgi:hypothetical protein